MSTSTSESSLGLPSRVADGLVNQRRVVAGRHRPRDYAVRRLLAGADVLATAAGLTFMVLVVRPGGTVEQVAFALATLPGWLVIFGSYGLYDRDIRRISHTTLDDIPAIFHSLLLGCLLLWLAFRAAPVRDVRFEEVLLFAVVCGAGMLLARGAARLVAARTLGPERVVLVGEDESLAVLARKIRAHPEYDLEPIGFLSRTGTAASAAGLPVLGEFVGLDLAVVVALHRVDRVVVAHDDVGGPQLLDLLRSCKELAVKVSVLPALFDAMGPSVVVDDVEGVTVLGIHPPVLARSSRATKRLMDVTGALCLLALAAPAMALVALAVRLDSRGPVFFTQSRVGRGGRRFRLVKFRTMVCGAEAMQEALRTQSSDPHWLKLDHDPRITRVGRVLRQWSLDELPQLWNVLRGEMSLVGPRPLAESESTQLTGWARTRVDLTPGLTGLWQVLGRTNIPFEEMIKLDYLYVTNWSLWTDVRLVLRTLPAVVVRRGAN